MTEKSPEPTAPVRYTSYHSDKTFSMLEWGRSCIKGGSGFCFEYNGMRYWFGSSSDTGYTIVDLTCCKMPKYLDGGLCVPDDYANPADIPQRGGGAIPLVFAEPPSPRKYLMGQS
jgi:hypothetical protein